MFVGHARMIVKWIHMGSALLSVCGFCLRGVWMMRESPMLKHRAVRVLPHVVDTVLLASAIMLAVQTHQYPFVHGWLTAKVLALLVYIGLGFVALRFGRTRRQRLLAWVAALATFGYITAVALSRNPFPV